jgi:outer membrane lipoprotein-sorting protein
MRLFPLKSLLAIFVIAAMPAIPARADTLEAVLARMDQEAASFKQIAADFTKWTYTKVLNDTTQESGTMWLKRQGRSVEMRTEIQQPEERSVGLDGEQAEIYYPKIRTVQIYSLGKNRGLVDQFLLLGFGSRGSSLEKNYTLKLGGQELISGQKTTRLELAPKAADVLKQIEKVELWIPLDGGHPIQQRFVQPGGDYYLVTYSGIKLNPSLPDAYFRLQLPPNVKREHPQR